MLRRSPQLGTQALPDQASGALSQALSSLWWSLTLPGHSGANELRTASKPCCAGDGASGSAVVGLDPDAGLIAALLVVALLALAPA